MGFGRTMDLPKKNKKKKRRLDPHIVNRLRDSQTGPFYHVQPILATEIFPVGLT